MLKAEKAALCERFEMIDQGEIHYLLGLSIKRDRESRTLTTITSTYLGLIENTITRTTFLIDCLFSALASLQNTFSQQFELWEQ